MKIHVLYYPHREGHNSIFPLFAYSQVLREAGFLFKFFSSLKEFKKDFPDLLVISGISLPKILGKKISTNQFLTECRGLRIPLIFLSGSDSTGPMDSKIIASVDCYLNRQILKDKTLYSKEHRRHYFRDKVFQEHSFKNQESYPLVAYNEEEIKKIGIYWNLGLIDWKTQTTNKLKRYYYIYKRNSEFKNFEIGTELNKRNLDISFRGNLFKGVHDVSRFHRLKSYRVYKKMSSKYKCPSDGIIPHVEYMKEMNDSKVCISPFGWGEVCYRDFEAFQAGTLLFKPKMDHLQTFPNFYKPENMVFYNWDASDLEEKIELVLSNINVFEETILNARQNFLDETSGKGASINFLKHFQKIVEQATFNLTFR
jgi:hypothetical protein